MTTQPYLLTVDGFAREFFRVHSFKGTETLSDVYDFEVVVTAEASDDLERSALGKNAVLMFCTGPEPRAFYGIVAAVRLMRVHEADQKIQYALRVVPRLWLLKRKKRTRIFQQKRVPDIVKEVLAEAGILVRFQLTRAYPVREYCTQYEETDYRFLTRILAEAGLYFYFFGGPPLSDAALAANAALEAASALGALAPSALAGAASALSAVAPLAETLIPGDTVVCADDASSYPAVKGDDPAALSISTAAALAPPAKETLGAASAVASAALKHVLGETPVLHYLQNEAARVPRYDKITQFSLRNAVRSNAATFRDYDPIRPPVRLQSAAVSSAPFPPSPLETAAMTAAAAENAASAVAHAISPGDAPDAASSLAQKAASAVESLASALTQKGMHEVYDHHAPFLFPKWGFARDEAPRILRQKRRNASVARGETGCSDFSPGHRFQLRNHPAAQLDRSYALIRVEHEGKAHPDPGQTGDSSVYSCSFECVPAEVTYPPRRQNRKAVQVALTATVVGPPGSEIHVDPLGQIKVQFHWDREGQYNDKSSCFLRVLQPWAGSGWGHQFIPRVGQEVVVVFEGGDPDKPMVLGALYNGTHPPPFSLPAEKTKSGIRTQTSPGGGGFNEISFEDAAGREQIYVHAQGNLNEVVGRNHTLLVSQDEHMRILGDRIDTIEKSLKEHIKGDHSITVLGNRMDLVNGNLDERVAGMRQSRVEGKEREQVEKAAEHEYADDFTVRVKGSMTTLVGKADRRRSWVTHAQGIASLAGTERLELRSEKELVLSVGKSSIRITSEKIEVLASGLSAKGEGGSMSVSDEGIALKSKDKAELQMTQKLLLKTDGASISMEKEVKVDGSQILLNSPDMAKDAKPKDPEPPTSIQLMDEEDGNALAYQRYIIKLDDGSEYSGLTDKDGHAELELSSGGNIVFPDLCMPGDSSAGALQPYVVRQGDYLQKLAFTHGFDADSMWNDPKNEELKRKRKDPNQLVPGDILYFAAPAREKLSIKKGASNEYKAKVPKTTLRFAFENEDGPFKDEPYFIEGLGAKVEGRADGEGAVFIKAPVHVREVRITFPDKRVVFPLHIGDMDPIDEPSGVQKRLEHLGYLPPPSDALAEEEIIAREKAAIASFQRAQGISETGELDDATKSALVRAHGS